VALRGRLEARRVTSFRPLDSLFFGGATAPDVRLHRRYNRGRPVSLAVSGGRGSIRGPIVIGAWLGSN
jgi:hypothetical protein